MSTTTTTAAVTEANPASHEGGLTRRDYISTYFRSSFMLGSFNFERFQAIGVAVSLMPTIKRFYHTKHDQAEALKRHLEFFNTTPWIASPIYGVVAAMEEERSKGGEIEDSDITNVKIGLMGPLAGVGDPVFWGTVRRCLLHWVLRWPSRIQFWARCSSSSASTSSVSRPVGMASSSATNAARPSSAILAADSSRGSRR